MLKVIGNSILVKEILTKIKRKIIVTTAKDTLDDDISYERKSILIGKGEQVSNNLDLDSIVILKSWAEPHYLEVESGKKGDQTIVRLAVYSEDAVACIKIEK